MIKNSFQRSMVIFTLLSFFVLLVVSCKKDKDTKPSQDSSSTSESYSKQITGKWEVGDGSSRIAANSSGYSSFEFTSSGSFVITRTDSTCVTGFYTVDNSTGIITLGTFGTVTITKVNGSVMNFTLRLTGSSTDITIFSTKKGKVLSTSSKTDSLCQSWKLVTYYLDGVENTIIRDSIQTGYFKATVVFSSIGTYLTIQEQKGLATQYQNGSWSWTDNSQTYINTSPTTTAQTFFVNGQLHTKFTSTTQGGVTHITEDVFQLVQQ